MSKCPICGDLKAKGSSKCADCYINNRDLSDIGQMSLDPPTKIQIKFDPVFMEKMLDGSKIVTTRQDQKGVPGNIFDAFGATFQIIDIKQAPLIWVIQNMWKAEGFESEKDCMAFLSKRYDITGYFYLHFFKRVDQ